MSLQFNTIGFINFSKEYNKVLKSGAITVSFTTSTKDKDGNYQTQYFNGLVPKKLANRVKPFINAKEPCLIKGVVNPAEKGYVNFTILEVGKYVKKDNVKAEEDVDLPF